MTVLPTFVIRQPEAALGVGVSAGGLPSLMSGSMMASSTLAYVVTLAIPCWRHGASAPISTC